MRKCAHSCPVNRCVADTVGLAPIQGPGPCIGASAGLCTICRLAGFRLQLPGTSQDWSTRAGLAHSAQPCSDKTELLAESATFGILLPITCRNGLHELQRSLAQFLDSLVATVPDYRRRIRLFIGVDDDDAPLCTLLPVSNQSCEGDSIVAAEASENVLFDLCGWRGAATSAPEHKQLRNDFLTIRYFNGAADFIPCRGAVCHYWRILARLAMSPSATDGCDACACVQRCVCAHASAAPCDFVILMGDDVRLETIGWADAVESAFESVKQRLLQREDLYVTEASCLPPFGCVALHDLSMPGAHPRGHEAPIPEARCARTERSGARVCISHG